MSKADRTEACLESLKERIRSAVAIMEDDLDAIAKKFEYRFLPRGKVLLEEGAQGNFWVLYNMLKHSELITSIEIPSNNFVAHSHYLKLCDRSSYAFALLSVAAALELNGTHVKAVRIAMGGAAHESWRATVAGKFLVGKAAAEANFKIAAQKETAMAKPLQYNKFKVPLGQKGIVRTLMNAIVGTGNI